ncbi:MAG: glycosyltransferase family 1 protein [Anaerolineae bacterium]|nr:glycosyltransferase family 1 protein [Anaerolineae bacterium]MDQ7036963.1 glycosyltransferase family 1 protein [Anaerolineae bacterium]
MTHIGIDARLTYYRDGGISTYIRRLIQALEAQETDAKFTIFHSRKDSQRISNRFDDAKLWTPAHHRIERLGLSLELAWRGLDVFHSPDFIPPYRGAKKHVITVHDLTFLHYPSYLTSDSRRYYNEQIAAACHHADTILAVSEASKNDLIQLLNVPAHKITVQPHGAGEQYRPMTHDETEPIRVALDIPRDCILHVGTWEPRKNIIGLLKAYQLLLDTMPDAPPVLLVGRRGWLFEEARAEIETLGINDHIIWRDSVTDEQLPAVYNLASVLVSPSFYEGFGMPALEAMACGTAPIVSNRSSLPEVVGDVGLLVNPDEPETIAQALQKALTESQWREEQSKAALERAALFTWERSAQIALQTYTSAL